MSFVKRRLLFAGLSLCLAFAGNATGAEGPGQTAGALKAEELYVTRRLDAEISPSGRYLALVQRVGEKDRLVIIDLESRTRSEIYSDPDLDVVNLGSLAWKGDDRLIFTRSGLKLRRGGNGQVQIRKREGDPIAMASDWEYKNLWSIARQGGPPVALSGQVDEMFTDIADLLEKDEGHLLIRILLLPNRFKDQTNTRLTHNRNGNYRLLKVDVVTGKQTIMEDGDDKTVGWGIDRQGRVNLRYDVFGRRGGWRVYGREEGQPWKELFTMRDKDVPAPLDLEILGQTQTPGQLYVAVHPTDRDKGDTRELRIFDFRTKTLGDRIWAAPEHDLNAITLSRDGVLTSACYWADTYRCHYFDKTLATEAAAIDRFFDGERNIRTISRSRSDDRRILSVSGPDEPGSLYLFDRKSGKIDLLGAQWPRLDPDRLGVMKRWDWTASDGLKLSGYLTEPPPALKATGPLPLVVMPHGGPEARDYFQFDRWAQAFATRGYLVYQPNFRGSDGFGRTFAEKGYRQWGLRMQTDVTEGIEALIKEGRVDPGRICIVGASYGGYVALQGGATRPDLFKCVISRAGVSDLIQMQEWEKQWFDSDSPRYQYWLKSIGDPKADAEALRAASPVTYAGKYGPPVLLIHGENDWIVPIEQSEIMRKALKKAGRPVTLSEYNEQDHGGWPEALDIRALNEMIAFVDQYIGARP